MMPPCDSPVECAFVLFLLNIFSEGIHCPVQPLNGRVPAPSSGVGLTSPRILGDHFRQRHGPIRFGP